MIVQLAIDAATGTSQLDPVATRQECRKLFVGVALFW